MRITDITGEIANGIWNYGPPFPEYRLMPLPEVDWVKQKVYCEIFGGLHSQTGTYLETPAHYFGAASYPLMDVPAEKLCGIPLTLIMLGIPDTGGSRFGISAEMLENAVRRERIHENRAIIVGCGWGRKWFDADYLSASPFFKYDAVEWLVSKKPFLLGSDLPRWENLEKPEGFFDMFYRADILMLAPCVNLENIRGNNHSLTVLPLKVTGTSCAPCRAIVMSEDEGKTANDR
ncbi:hypothetical protein SDC9_128783 [bioreactor metagenome]|uniref:Arylformamidase n=1 Tax=bioreactor metagenome TaxID=1076179 RepID=A0A645CX79_9ZZZZ|nr:cyclase family protein [Oscillospiraceae bacterium]